MLDHYPPKEAWAGTGAAAPRAVPLSPAPAPSASSAARVRPPDGATPGAPAGGTAPAEGLIRLDRPFDVDEFSQMLGETRFRVTVPQDALAEVLRRVVDFMGFGIYIYAVEVRPAPSELLRGYVVELQRVEFDAASNSWRPFVERGSAGSPSSGTGTP